MRGERVVKVTADSFITGLFQSCLSPMNLIAVYRTEKQTFSHGSSSSFLWRQNYFYMSSAVTCQQAYIALPNKP